jgi:glycosyltransferase involved in cell wall biosynthesis
MKQIGWFSPPGIGEGMGYGYAAVRTIKGLQNSGVKVAYDNREAKCHISFIQPEYYSGDRDQYRIGYTPWESSVVPDTWPKIMQEMQEIWTPSQYCVDIFNEYNVNNIIRKVPHGIDPEIWKIENRFISDKFVFLHIGGPTARKGGQRVVDAFLDLFDDRNDVALILKSNESTECRYYDKYGAFKSAKHHPQIMVIDHSVDVEDLVKIYNKAHCLVYPTNGEGFGLIPFQGIATGLPTIVTNATACADFAELSIPLNSRPAPGEGVHLGDWVEPDPDDLRDKMRYVFENFDEVKQKTMHSANVIHATQTWDKVAEQIVDILGEKIYERA